MATILVAAALVLFSNVGFFKTATAAFTDRYEGANETEGGVVEGVIGDRVFGSMLKAITGSADQSIFGFGVGSGTSLGADLLKDTRVSLLADFEWMRQIGELGLMGLLVIALRVGLAIKLTLASYKKLKRSDMLPWLLMSVGVFVITQGQWHQSTALGYCALIGGLAMASLKVTASKKTIENKKKNSSLKGSGNKQMAQNKPGKFTI